MQTKVKAVKSTLKTIEKYGFDRAGLDANMKDYGYTTRIEYGCIAIIDDAGEAVDYGRPVLVTYQGEKYGDVLFSEMETTICCGETSFSTVFDEIDWNF